MKKDRFDKMILGEGHVYSTNPEFTGLNNNVVVIGASGSGKTMSVTEARLLETFNSSLICTATKRRIVEKYKPILKKRGYNVWDLNFVSPRQSVGYDPLKYIGGYSDISNLARSLVMSDSRKAISRSADPFWDQAAISLLSAEIGYTFLTAESASFNDVLKLHRSLSFEERGYSIKTNLDDQFEKIVESNPSGFIASCWKTFSTLPQRTAACVYSTLSTSLDAIFTPEVCKIFDHQDQVDLSKLANEKTVLFITSSPVNPHLNSLNNIFYGQAFRALFEIAENETDGAVRVPVSIIADDFATGCPIPNFDEYISIFREKGVSMILLLQSESQLAALYGPERATTILNNCDTYLFLGSNDLTTANHISLRADRPLSEILTLPLGQEILFRRGQKPVFTKRYDIVKDERYQKATRQYNDYISAQMGR